MAKTKKSGSAIFMYIVIAITLVLSVVCFTLYYGKIFVNEAVCWTGIVSFMIMYHLWLRIIMGNVSKLFKPNPKNWWFREKPFEKKLYKLLRVKKWKGKALTYNPEAFSLKTNSLDDVAMIMVKSELDHWINQIISLLSVLFSLIWGRFAIFLITAICAMLFDGQFIVIQRYNRPRIMKVIAREKKQKEKTPALV